MVFLHSKRLFNDQNSTNLIDHIKPIISVHIDTPLKKILEMMKRKKIHIAAIYEDNDFKGIITLENILEEIVGDIEDEYN